MQMSRDACSGKTFGDLLDYKFLLLQVIGILYNEHQGSILTSVTLFLRSMITWRVCVTETHGLYQQIETRNLRTSFLCIRQHHKQEFKLRSLATSLCSIRVTMYVYHPLCNQNSISRSFKGCMLLFCHLSFDVIQTKTTKSSSHEFYLEIEIKIRPACGEGWIQVEMAMKHDCWGTCWDRVIIQRRGRAIMKVFSAYQWDRKLWDWMPRWCTMRKAKQGLLRYASNYLL